MADFIVVIVILAIVSLAGLYVYRARKHGQKCIGCPGGCSCSCGAESHSADSACSACTGCSGCGK